MTADSQRPFWMVYRVGARGSKRLHLSQVEAETEAKRLARLWPREVIVTLKADGAWLLDNGNLVWFDARFALAAHEARHAN